MHTPFPHRSSADLHQVGEYTHGVLLAGSPGGFSGSAAARPVTLRAGLPREVSGGVRLAGDRGRLTEPGRFPCRSPRSPCRASPSSEEHTSELQSLMRLSYAVFCLKKKKKTTHTPHTQQN